MNIDKEIVNSHEQKYRFSCIPSAVEIVLKLLKRVDHDYYELQHSWDDRTDGSFADFDGKTVRGLTFKVPKSGSPRASSFPLETLFATIDQELGSGRFIIVSLPEGSDWHMYVIYDKLNDDYEAITKKYDAQNTFYINDVKKRIMSAQGTDILVYE